MEIIKRDQSVQAYDRRKISRAVSAAFASVGHPLPEMTKEAILDQVEVQIRGAAETAPVSVEQIQDWVEQALMRQNCYEEARHYILYRQEHARLRDQIDQLRRIIPDPEILATCRQLQRDFSQPAMSLDALIQKVQAFSKEKMKRSQQLDNLIRACVELVSQEAPDWEKAAARFMMIKLRRSVSQRMEAQGIRTLAQKLLYLEAQGLLNKDLSEHYSYNDLNRLEQAIDNERDQLFNASGQFFPKSPRHAESDHWPSTSRLSRSTAATGHSTKRRTPPPAASQSASSTPESAPPLLCAGLFGAKAFLPGGEHALALRSALDHVGLDEVGIAHGLHRGSQLYAGTDRSLRGVLGQRLLPLCRQHPVDQSLAGVGIARALEQRHGRDVPRHAVGGERRLDLVTFALQLFAGVERRHGDCRFARTDLVGRLSAAFGVVGHIGVDAFEQFPAFFLALRGEDRPDHSVERAAHSRSGHQHFALIDGVGQILPALRHGQILLGHDLAVDDEINRAQRNAAPVAVSVIEHRIVRGAFGRHIRFEESFSRRRHVTVQTAAEPYVGLRLALGRAQAGQHLAGRHGQILHLNARVLRELLQDAVNARVGDEDAELLLLGPGGADAPRRRA